MAIIESRLALYLIYAFVFLSGACGLIYEIVWQRYLSIMLGADAKATAYVLLFFLTGLGVGYEIFGRLSKRLNLFKTYAFLELGIGIWAIYFPLMFKYVFYNIDSNAGRLFFSMLMIGLPSLLMGGTLPLIIQGIFRSNLSQNDDISLKIYGCNTVGAFLGAIIAGFYLVPFFGLIKTSSLVGFINVLIGVFVLAFYAKKTQTLSAVTINENENSFKETKLLISKNSFLLLLSFSSGLWMIVLQNIFSRVMALSSGSSHYHFTIVVASFVLILGLSSYAAASIKNKSFAQLSFIIFIFSILIGLLYNGVDSFPYYIHRLRLVFRTADENFYIYQLALFLSVLGILFLPLFFAGLLLPYCFSLHLKRKQEIGAVFGTVFSFNTMGCVAGGIGGGYFLLDIWNLDELYRFCFVLVGLIFLVSMFVLWVDGFKKYTLLRLMMVSSIFFMGYSFQPWEKSSFAHPFRYTYDLPSHINSKTEFNQKIFKNHEYLYYKDAPEGTVAISKSEDNGKESDRTLFVNGKSDGSTAGDYFTMSMTGHLPALLSDKINDVFVVGYGTGITLGSLLSYSEVKHLRVGEISEALSRNVSLFDRYNGNASKDPRLEIEVADAFQSLVKGSKKYDLIISEPSNPWVTGVENLYTTEFYSAVKKSLNEKGLFTQWLQAYYFNEELFERVLATVSSQFKYVRVFQVREFELLITASNSAFDKQSYDFAKNRLNQVSVIQSLKQAGIMGLESVLSMEVMSPSLVTSFTSAAKPYYVESTNLSFKATRAFFSGQYLDVAQIARSQSNYFKFLPESLLGNFIKDKSALEVIEQLYSSFCRGLPSVNSQTCTRIENWNVKYESNKIPLSIDAINMFKFLLSANKKELKNENDLNALRQAFEWYQKNVSEFLYFPKEIFITALDNCLNKTSYQDELYGKCLLEKVKFLEWFGEGEENILSFYNELKKWLKVNRPSYSDKISSAENKPSFF